MTTEITSASPPSAKGKTSLWESKRLDLSLATSIFMVDL